MASGGYGVDGGRKPMYMRCISEYPHPLGPPKGRAGREGYSYRREVEHAWVEVDIQSEKGDPLIAYVRSGKLR